MSLSSHQTLIPFWKWNFWFRFVYVFKTLVNTAVGVVAEPVKPLFKRLISHMGVLGTSSDCLVCDSAAYVSPARQQVRVHVVAALSPIWKPSWTSGLLFWPNPALVAVGLWGMNEKILPSPLFFSPSLPPSYTCFMLCIQIHNMNFNPLGILSQCHSIYNFIPGYYKKKVNS